MTQLMSLGDQLLPCPLCGGRAEFIEELKTTHIKCNGCGIATPKQTSFDPQNSLENARYWARSCLHDRWNQRAEQKKIKTRFLVQTRDTYDEEHKNMSQRQWRTTHNCQYPPNPQFPQEYIAKKLGRDRLAYINAEPKLVEEDYDDDEEDREPEYCPKPPVYMEYRIVRVTEIEEVIEYGDSKTMGPVFQKDPDLIPALEKQKQRDGLN